MHDIVISVAAASRMLLRRGYFGRSALGDALHSLLHDGIVQESDWPGFAVYIGDVIFLSVPDDRVECALVVPPDSFAGIAEKEEALRIADRALRVFVTEARGSTENPSWHVYHAGSLLSVFASPIRETDSLRVCFELALKSKRVIGLYAIRPLSEVENLGDRPPTQEFSAKIESVANNIDLYRREARVVALGTAGKDLPAIIDHVARTQYRETVANNIAQGRIYSDWLEFLDERQRQFIGELVDRPIRLHGAAGTGKTLCLLIKILHEMKRAIDPKAIALMAYSESMRGACADAIDVLDPDGGIREASVTTLEVVTLFEWCIRYLGDELEPVQLVDRDATESRVFQREIILRCVEEAYEEAWTVYRPHVSGKFRRIIEEERNEVWFATLLQHEIACVIKGNGIRAFNQQAYMKLNRPRQALPLELEADRKFIFAIYGRYENELQEYGVFDADDVVCEVLNRLESPLWTRQRQSRGYDYIFVDEAHVANDNERSLVRYLMKDAFGLPRIVMAIDLLQSIGDSGLWEDSCGNLITQAGVAEEMTRQELREVHRSSRPILNLAQAVVSVGKELFDTPPKIEIDETTGNGETPVMASCTSLEEQIAKAFSTAKRWKGQYKWAAHEIAVICATERSLLGTIEYANRQKKAIRVIDRRSDQEATAEAAKFSSLIVVSAEFSAGLQFNGVIILDVSAGLVPNASDAIAGAKSAMMRRSVSEIYLALSRARRKVLITVDKTTGPSPLLEPALHEGLLLEE